MCPKDMHDDSPAEPKTIQAETPLQAFSRRGVPLTLVDAEEHGWSRVHDYLRPAPDGQPWLMVSPTCHELARTIPSLVSDPNDEDSLASGQNDRAALTLRTLIASRPQPGTPTSTPTPPPEYSLAWFRERDVQPRGVLSLSR
jgi:hypothetical protein